MMWRWEDPPKGGYRDLPRGGWGTKITTRGRVLAYACLFALAFIAGLTAEWWDPFARWPR
jgi:hypothetical protein